MSVGGGGYGDQRMSDEIQEKRAGCWCLCGCGAYLCVVGPNTKSRVVLFDGNSLVQTSAGPLHQLAYFMS